MSELAHVHLPPVPHKHAALSTMAPLRQPDCVSLAEASTLVPACSGAAFPPQDLRRRGRWDATSTLECPSKRLLLPRAVLAPLLLEGCARAGCRSVIARLLGVRFIVIHEGRRAKFVVTGVRGSAAVRIVWEGRSGTKVQRLAHAHAPVSP